MSEKAKAALVSVNLETGDVKISVYDEEIGHGDPAQACWNLWESIKEDWPGYLPAVIMNDASGEIQTKRRLKELGIEEDE